LTDELKNIAILLNLAKFKPYKSQELSQKIGKTFIYLWNVRIISL